MIDTQSTGTLDNLVWTRAEALEAGRNRYYTGEPCVRGHVDERMTRNYTCAACYKENRRAYRKKNRKKLNQKKREKERVKLVKFNNKFAALLE